MKTVSIIAGVMVLSALALASLAQAQAPGKKLSAAEIPGFVYGKNWRSDRSDGSAAVHRVAANGDSTVEVSPRGRKMSMKGKFFVRGETMCFFYEAWQEGRESCFTVFQNGERLVTMTGDGSIAAVWSPVQ